MKLIICSKRVYETSPGTYKSVRFPIGELRRNEETGIWLMMLYLDPSVEYLVVEQSDENEPSRNRRFSVFSHKSINDEGIDDVRQYKIGRSGSPTMAEGS